mmetsp:Transcript_6343/g.20857  ORF Transcript_6343/g.20857 Transcript_6343/m.20857 type:complete len:391 (+) Transcript_6343:761-1933(+)|eukprot:scaffold15696_cov113-Isochrysis_galbana.AAC.3
MELFERFLETRLDRERACLHRVQHLVRFGRDAPHRGELLPDPVQVFKRSPHNAVRNGHVPRRPVAQEGPVEGRAARTTVRSVRRRLGHGRPRARGRLHRSAPLKLEHTSPCIRGLPLEPRVLLRCPAHHLVDPCLLFGGGVLRCGVLHRTSNLDGRILGNLTVLVSLHLAGQPTLLCCGEGRGQCRREGHPALGAVTGRDNLAEDGDASRRVGSLPLQPDVLFLRLAYLRLEPLLLVTRGLRCRRSSGSLRHVDRGGGGGLTLHVCLHLTGQPALLCGREGGRQRRCERSIIGVTAVGVLPDERRLERGDTTGGIRGLAFQPGVLLACLAHLALHPLLLFRAWELSCHAGRRLCCFYSDVRQGLVLHRTVEPPQLSLREHRRARRGRGFE